MAVDVAHFPAAATRVLGPAPKAPRSGYARLALTAAAGMLLLAAAGGARAQRSVDEPSTPVQPAEFTELSGVSTDVAVPEAPAAAPGDARPARRSAAPAAAPADPPASNSGGQTSVVAGNGTEETDTSSGGAHVNNDATVKSQTGVQSGDPEP